MQSIGVMRGLTTTLYLASIAAAQPQTPHGVLKTRLDSIAQATQGSLGYSLHHLKTGDRLERLGDDLFRTESTLKVAIMCAAMEQVAAGKEGYYNIRGLIPADRTSGSGFFQNYRDGTEIEFKELVHQMIAVSDNTATLMLMRWIGGADPVNGWLQRHGLKKTRLIHQYPISEELAKDEQKIEELKRAVGKWGMGVSTPNEMRQLMEMIVDGRAGSPAAADEMWRILSHQFFDGGIASQIPPSVSVASKSGRSPIGRADMAIVSSPSGIYVLVIFAQIDRNTNQWQDQVSTSLRQISRVVWQHYHPTDKWSPPPGAEKLW